MKSFFFYFSIFIVTFFLGIVALPLVILPKGHKLLLLFAKTWAKTTLGLFRIFCSMKLELLGSLPQKLPFIVASQHQSAWETIFFLVLFENPAFVLKKELTKIPIYGWFLGKLGMIIIDRKAGMQAVKELKKGAAEVLAAGRPLIIFPEGTRVKPGKKVPYKSGIKILAETFNVPVIPVKLNSGLYWSQAKTQVIKVEILQPFLAKHNFLQELQATMEEEFDVKN